MMIKTHFYLKYNLFNSICFLFNVFTKERKMSKEKFLVLFCCSSSISFFCDIWNAIRHLSHEVDGKWVWGGWQIISNGKRKTSNKIGIIARSTYEI